MFLPLGAKFAQPGLQFLALGARIAAAHFRLHCADFLPGLRTRGFAFFVVIKCSGRAYEQREDQYRHEIHDSPPCDYSLPSIRWLH
jgi:hypothetical protein